MLATDKNEIRKERHHITQEDFTPDEIVKLMCDQFQDDTIYTDFSKTVLDPCAGTGNILLYVFNERLMYCKCSEDVYNALSTIYGTELMADNVEECHERFMKRLQEIEGLDKNKIKSILEHNIVCTDTFDWDYENWKSMPKTNALF